MQFLLRDAYMHSVVLAVERWLWFCNTALWLRNSNGKESLSLGRFFETQDVVYCWHCCKSCGSVPWVAWKFLALLQSFSWMLIIIIIKHLLSSCQLHHVTQYRESWNITIHNIKTTHMKLYSIHKYKYTSLRKVLTLFHTYYSMD